MFMRVPGTVPQFTFSLSERFVNALSSVSTGFFRFFPVFVQNEARFFSKCPKNTTFLCLHNLSLSPPSRRISGVPRSASPL
jgi:hypothetical protein